MTVHTIMLPDRMRGREPRRVIWDDEAGTVTGEHSRIPWMQEVLARPTPVNFCDDEQVLFLKDPAHDPRDFLHLLGEAYWPIYEDPDRQRLPPALRDIKPRPVRPPANAILDENGLIIGPGHYDEDGNLVVMGVY